MDRSSVTQQTSTALPISSNGIRVAPPPKTLHSAAFDGWLQWALEGAGWSLLRPATDFVLMCVAVVLALGGVYGALHPPAVTAPLLALPPLVVRCSACAGCIARGCAPWCSTASCPS